MDRFSQKFKIADVNIKVYPSSSSSRFLKNKLWIDQERTAIAQKFLDKQIIHQILFGLVDKVCRFSATKIDHKSTNAHVRWHNGCGITRYRGCLMYWIKTLGKYADYDKVSDLYVKLGDRWTLPLYIKKLFTDGTSITEN